MNTKTMFIITFMTTILLVSCGKNNETATAKQNEQTTSEKVSTTEVVWYDDWDKGMEAAKKEQKPVYIHFTAAWCSWCRKMENETYSAADVKKSFISDWITISLDTEDTKKTGKVYLDESAKSVLVYLKGDKGSFEEKALSNQQLMQFFGGKGLPTLLFIDKEGAPVEKISSYIQKEEFGVILDFLSEEAYKKNISFEDFKKKKAGEGI